jgi:soluble lytic murein transglycosylase-like protein
MKTTRFLFPVFSILLAYAVSSPAFAVSPEQYFKIRRQSGFDPRLTFAQVEANPAAYLNRSLEIKGILNGTLRRDQSISFMLTLDNNRTVLMEAPPEDTDLIANVNHQKLRVLVKVKEAQGQNVAPVTVLAIAVEAEVAAREAEAIRREEALRRQEAERREAPSRSVRNPANMMPSRNLRVRRIPEVAIYGPLSAEAQRVYPIYRSFIANHNRRLNALELDQITYSILYFSERHRLDPRLVVALIIAESDFRPNLTSHKGAMGLGQLMPDEAQSYGLNNPYDPYHNVRAAVNLLKQRLLSYRERDDQPEEILTWRQIELALASYNAGSGAVRRFGGIPPFRETQNYVRKVVRVYKELIGIKP